MSETKVRETDEIVRSERVEPPWRPAVRFVIAVGLAAGISRFLWSLVPSQLSIKTDIVGYPIFADFNATRYTDGYYFFALVFPALAVLIYLIMSSKGPLRRWTSPERAMFPVAIGHTAEHDSEAAGEPGGHVDLIDALWCAARVALVALTVALEVAVALSGTLHLGNRGSYLGAIAYVGVVAGITLSLRRWFSRASDVAWTTVVARANSVAAIGVIPLLYFSSRGTSVAVGSAYIVRYPWVPLWLAVALTLIALLAWRRGEARANTAADRRELEAKVLTWVVGPVLLLLVLASLPGALGAFQGFDDSQVLATPQLVFQHGLLPWRDIYAFHGILSDVLDGAIGMVVFGHSRWGVAAGISIWVFPSYLLVLYAFVAYFCRKNRLILVGFSIAIATGLLSADSPRFLLVPVFFILLDQVLRRPGWMRCALFMFVLFAGAILTPEATLFVPCLFGTVFLFELAGHARSTSLSTSFTRTWRCLAVGAALTAAWVVFLLATRSLSAFVDYFLYFLPGHDLEGSYPTTWNLAQGLLLTFEWVLPTILLLVTIWRVVRKLRTRSPWEFREWVMVSAALCSAAYFPQALGRSDQGHVFLSFSVAVPLLLLWVIDLLDRGDRNLRRVLPEWSGLRHVVTGAAVVAVFLGTTGVLGTAGQTSTVSAVIRSVPANFHKSVVQGDLTSNLLGYTVPGAVDTQQVDALGEVLNRYAGRSSPVFDFSNEPGIIYYLLNRVPGTRFYYSAVIQTPSAQKAAISDLTASRPPIVIFSNTTFGLTSYDGIPQSLRSYLLSVYMFAHYRPLLDVQGQLVLLRDDLFSKAPPVPDGDATTDLYYDTPTCNFGDIPNFLNVPQSVAHQPGVRLDAQQIANDEYFVRGWAIDAVTKSSAAEVLAAVKGRVVATGQTGVPRPDVAAALRDPAAGSSGFTLSIPASEGPVTLYALNSNGTVSPLAPSSSQVGPVIGRTVTAEVTTPDGMAHAVVSSTSSGDVDGVTRQSYDEYQVTPPIGQSFGSYSWLRVSSTEGLHGSTFTLSDQPSAPVNHEIVFRVLPQPATSIFVGVGSCLQWHGYPGAATIYVNSSEAAQGLSFSLIR